LGRPLDLKKLRGAQAAPGAPVSPTTPAPTTVKPGKPAT
jgi:hypothetical protein